MRLDCTKSGDTFPCHSTCLQTTRNSATSCNLHTFRCLHIYLRNPKVAKFDVCTSFLKVRLNFALAMQHFTLVQLSMSFVLCMAHVWSLHYSLLPHYNYCLHAHCWHANCPHNTLPWKKKNRTTYDKVLDMVIDKIGLLQCHNRSAKCIQIGVGQWVWQFLHAKRRLYLDVPESNTGTEESEWTVQTKTLAAPIWSNIKNRQSENFKFSSHGERKRRKNSTICRLATCISPAYTSMLRKHMGQIDQDQVCAWERRWGGKT